MWLCYLRNWKGMVKEQIPDTTDSGMNERTCVFGIKLLNESCFSDQWLRFCAFVEAHKIG